MIWKLLVLVLGCFQYARAYSKGAPAQICDSMVPGHRATPQTGASPYTISAPVEKCKKDVSVTISGSPFKGFLCQPRKNKDVPQTSGTFSPLGQSSQMQNNCETLTSLCHTSNETKSSIQFKWAPAGNETVYIVCSFVQDYNTFWVKQSSPAVTLNVNDPSCSRASPFVSAVPSAMTLIALFVIWLLKDN